MSDTIGRTIYQLGFQISPIILTNGIADYAGGYLPIIALTEGPNAAVTLLAGGNPLNLDNFFAHFAPVSGSTILNYSIGQYPFANQSVAANAIIAEPLNISMRMNIPVNKRGGHTAKLATMLLLQTLLQKHAEFGGTYTIVTPAAFYTNCILTKLYDVSSSADPIPQNAWQFDFMKPLITLSQAEGAQSTLMRSVTQQTPTNGSWNSTAANGGVPSAVPTGVVGQNPLSLPNSIPSVR
jgi:hypothetical protein